MPKKVTPRLKLRRPLVHTMAEAKVRAGTRKPAPITDQELAAVDAYWVNGYNQKRACLTAGYSEKQARASSHIFKRPAVVAEMQARQALRSARYEATEANIIKEYAKIAFSNLGELLTVQEDGTAFIDMRLMTPEIKAAISEFQSEEISSGRGEDAVPVTKVKVKFHDKKGALDSLARHFGMFNDKLKVEGEVSLVDRLQAGRKRVRKPGEDDGEADKS